MKKIISTTVMLILILATASMAQIAIGAKGGININTIKIADDTDNSEDFNSRIGFHLGGYAIIPITSNIDLMPEFLWDYRGAEDSDGTALKLHYLSIPVLVRWRPINLLSLHTGPNIGINTIAKVDEFPLGEFFSGFDLGWAFGVEVHLTGKWKAGARYNLGLSNVVNSSFSESSLKNRFTHIYVAFTILGNDKRD